MKLRVALFAASGAYPMSARSQANQMLLDWDLEPLYFGAPQRHPSIPSDYLAGSDEHRFAELRWALTCPADLAWALRGGYGIARLLERIDEVELQERPLLGFSDLTALQWALVRRGWKRVVHAPNALNLMDYGGRTRSALRALFDGEPQASWPLQVWREGPLQGPLVGGNINVLAGLCGTPEAFVGRDQVVFLEEVREVPYRLDHNLTQLRRAGCFEGARGIVLGSFAGCGRPELVRAILEDRLGDLGIPLLAGAPAGHGNVFRPFIQGQQVEWWEDRLHFAPVTGIPR